MSPGQSAEYRVMCHRSPNLDGCERISHVCPNHCFGLRDRVRAMVVAILCIAFFNGAHIAYRASYALDWYDIQMLLATEANAPGYCDPEGNSPLSIEV